ncbi:hypothetical protein C8A06_0094 [Microbacteriaceae bacterium MWH-Ta3]|nr:hypothetical protein C8A06_0094 [Microbacteriaceae bacterium MWH-Ta3]
MSNTDDTNDTIQIMSDGNGIALFGDAATLDRFLSTAGVPSHELELGNSLNDALHFGSAVVAGGAEITANAGRWVKLTEESAEALKLANALGNVMKGSSGSVSRAIVKTSKGKFAKILEFAKPGTIGSMLTNPAALAGVAGIMAQMAMQQTMKEITDYLAVIDEKVDDILRAQKDAPIAHMIGVGLVIDDAILKRELVGRVSEVTWSSLHGAAQTIAETQSYALRQLDAIAAKLEKKSSVSDLAKSANNAEREVEEWLAVLARCFQLQDALAILELDRVMDSSPADLDRHREALQIGRNRRRELIAESTGRLLERMDTAASKVNSKVLLHPLKPGQVIRAGNEIGTDVLIFHETLGIASTRDALEQKRWATAAAEARDSIIDKGEVGLHIAAKAGSAGATAVGRLGAATSENAKTAASKIADGLKKKVRRPGPESQSEQ